MGASSSKSEIPELPLLILSISKIDNLHRFFEQLTIDKIPDKEFQYLKIFKKFTSDIDCLDDCLESIKKQLNEKNIFSIEGIYRQILLQKA